MAISYEKLGIILAEKGLKRTELLKVVSSKTLAKLNKNDVITTETIDKICLFLDCQPNDIMEVYKNPQASPKFDFKKKIYIPNSDGNYTIMQKTMFKDMVKENIINRESIEKWLKDDIFKQSYEYELNKRPEYEKHCQGEDNERPWENKTQGIE